MPDLIALAAKASLEEFLESYDASKVDKIKPSTGRTLLHAAVTNPDLAARVAIAERLLDDGIDATATMRDPDDTVLHLLFARPEHDWAAETPLVERLIEAGVDVDAKAGGVTPMVIFVERGFAADPATDGLVEAILARTSVDFSALVSFEGRPKKTLGEYVLEQTGEDRPLHRAAASAA